MYASALYDDAGIRPQALAVLRNMKLFFDGIPNDEYRGVLDYQIEKITQPSKRYAQRIREQFGDDFTGRGLLLSKGQSLRTAHAAL